jgi:hypothetical protein
MGPRRGHIRATIDRTAADNHGHYRAVSAQLTGRAEVGVAGRRDPPAVPDTEEDGGSTPPAPTTPCVTRAFVDHFAPPMDRDRQSEVADGRESVSLFNQGVHLGPQLSAGPHTSPAVDLDLRPGPPLVSPLAGLRRSCVLSVSSSLMPRVASGRCGRGCGGVAWWRG